MTKLEEVAAMESAPGPVDVIDVLTAEHRRLVAVLDRCDADATSARSAATTRQALVDLTRHMNAEETFLYPEVRLVVARGELWADRQLAEHADAAKLIDELWSLHWDHWMFEPTLSALLCHVRAHFAEEEQALFPSLVQHCAPERRAQLGWQVGRGGAGRRGDHLTEASRGSRKS